MAGNRINSPNNTELYTTGGYITLYKIMYKVYKIINTITEEICYIGITKGSLIARLARHISESFSSKKPTKKNSFFKAHLKKYGWEGLSIKGIKRELTKKEALKWENKFMIKYLKLGHNLVNTITPLKSHQATKEYYKKMSEKMMGNKNPQYGKISPFKGKHHTEEVKNHFHKLYTGKPLSEKIKIKISRGVKEAFKNTDCSIKMIKFRKGVIGTPTIGNNLLYFPTSKSASRWLITQGVRLTDRGIRRVLKGEQYLSGGYKWRRPITLEEKKLCGLIIEN